MIATDVIFGRKRSDALGKSLILRGTDITTKPLLASRLNITEADVTDFIWDGVDEVQAIILVPYKVDNSATSTFGDQLREIIDGGNLTHWGDPNRTNSMSWSGKASNTLVKVDLPGCIYHAPSGDYWDTLNSLQLLNMPNCLIWGAHTDYEAGMFRAPWNPSNCIINVHPSTRLANNGEPEGDLQYALSKSGVRVVINEPLQPMTQLVVNEVFGSMVTFSSPEDDFRLATRFDIYIDGVLQTSHTNDAGIAVLQNLEPNTLYSNIKVVAYNAFGETLTECNVIPSVETNNDFMGAIAGYRFDDPVEITDFTGNNQDPISYQVTGLAVDAGDGLAVQLSGTDYIELPFNLNKVACTPENPWTIFVWAKPTSIPGEPTLVSQGYGGYNTGNLSTYRSRFVLHGSYQTHIPEQPLNKKDFTVITWDGVQAMVYRNGNEYTKAVGGLNQPEDLGIVLGSKRNNPTTMRTNTTYHGFIYKALFFNSFKTLEEIEKAKYL